jgi:hypothetical protein
MPEPWDVFYVRDCRHTTPRKNKFVVIAHLETAPHAFFINSRINPFL